MSITLTFSQTPESTYEGCRAHRDLQARLFFRVFLNLFRFFIAYAGIEVLRQGNTSLLGPLMMAFGLYPLVAPLITRWQLRRKFAALPELRAPTTWTFSEQGVVREGELGSANTPWRAFVTIASSRSGLMLYPQPRLFNWFPPTAFARAEDISSILDMAAAGGVANVRRQKS